MRLGPAAAILLVVACSSVAPTPTPSVPSGPTSAPSASPTVQPSATPVASPTLAPFPDQQLPEATAARLQAVLDGYVTGDGRAPSMSAAVIVPGLGAWYGVAGSADRSVGHEVAATPDTVYGTGSITKTFTAALILRLAEEGFLGLDDPAADLLGPVAASKSNGATVRQLLAMRSGIDDYASHLGRDMTVLYSVADLLGLIGTPHFAPGADYEYSNSNYLLLGLIAEVVTGGPLGELLHEYLIDRFDLSRTYYCATDDVAEPLAHGYWTVDGQLRDVYDGSGRLPYASAASAARGAGAVASTSRDLADWLYLLFGGQVLRPESLAEMLDFSASGSYGLGVTRVVLPGPRELIGHSGSVLGFMGAAYQVRDSGAIVVVLTNGEAVDVVEALGRLLKGLDSAQ